MKTIYFLFTLILIPSVFAYSQEEGFDELPYQKMDFLILYASKTYEPALEFAEAASEKTGIPLDLRGLEPYGSGGLAFSDEICEEVELEEGCFSQRGREGDSAFVSVEYTDDYDGFTKGYYIVVAWSGESGSKTGKDMLKKVKQDYPSAYMKRTSIYMGCMH